MKNLFYFLSLLVFIGTTSCSNDDDSTSEPTKSNAKAITSFKFNATDNDELDENNTAVINENDKTIMAAVPYGTDITSLVPTIEVSPKATFSPEGAQDFSSEITYTVTAEDGTKAVYTVTITVIPNNEAKILSFVFLAENNPALEDNVTATIDEDTKTITAEVPYGTDVTGLTPTLEVSPDATFIPEGAQDFSSEMVYTVTAQNETTTNYTVTLQIAMEPQRAALIAIYNANPGNTLGWDLEDQDISNWQGVITDEGGNVTGLNLNFKQLTSIPVEIGQLSNLTSMDLGRNQLSSIPTKIEELANLTELFLDENQLTSIPAEIGQLSNLEYLFLHTNQLTSVPAEIGQLDNLKQLDLGSNQLSSLPTEIGQLSMLSSLHIINNQLTSIPAEIGQLSNLTILRLYDNQLTSIPSEIGQLSMLRSVDLSGNQLASVPAEIGQLSKLSSLNLNDNQLTSLPAEIGQLSNLKYLILDDNQLTSLPAEIGQLSNLTELRLYINLLTSIPQEVCDLETNHGTDIQVDEGVTCQ